MNPQTDALERGADIIIATPGRLVDFIDENIVKLSQLKCLILDEVDEVMTPSFVEEVEKAFKIAISQASEKPQTLLFSVTLPSWLRSISDQFLDKNCTVVDLIGRSQMTIPKTIRHFKYNMLPHE